jgi:hypothetical protein
VVYLPPLSRKPWAIPLASTYSPTICPRALIPTGKVPCRAPAPVPALGSSSVLARSGPGVGVVQGGILAAAQQEAVENGAGVCIFLMGL